MANIADPRCGVGRHNLGVFFWATGSAMDQNLPPCAEPEADASTVETE